LSELSTLSPVQLWSFFEQICSIPHPSHHEQALSDWIVDWASAEGLAVRRDSIGNLIISKPASAGMETRKGVILQAHLDMVPQKNTDVPHDFSRDPIRPYVDGEWVTARDTTLGADNGIGLASILAVLADRALRHGPLEVLLTVNEEAGMSGARALKPGLLKGEILLNTDAEQEGEIYMGCAGGVNANLRLALALTRVTADQVAFTLSLSGLKGGHSGCDIHLQRGNANKLMARLLKHLEQQLPLQLAELGGGSLRNAIPREARAIVTVPSQSAELLAAEVSAYQALLQHEFGPVEPTLKLSLVPQKMPTEVLDETSQVQLLNLLMALPDGVMAMSGQIDGVVETSTNLGVVRQQQDHAYIQCLLRSLVDSKRELLQQVFDSVAQLAGAALEFDDFYPGWTPDLHSPVMARTQQLYQQRFGLQPKIMVIHAGLECGLFKEAYPHWDMVSFGPTIRFPHSPDERVHIASVDKYWQLLTGLLEAIPEKDS